VTAGHHGISDGGNDNGSDEPGQGNLLQWVKCAWCILVKGMHSVLKEEHRAATCC
jgi:hypothetical protein